MSLFAPQSIAHHRRGRPTRVTMATSTTAPATVRPTVCNLWITGFDFRPVPDRILDRERRVATRCCNRKLPTCFTLGGIFSQPRGILGGALDYLVSIVDYYDIEIEQAVGSLSGAAIARSLRPTCPLTDKPVSATRIPCAILLAAGRVLWAFTSGNSQPAGACAPPYRLFETR